MNTNRATNFIEPGAMTSQGLRTDKLVIVVSQPDERGDVHYVRLPVGSISFIVQ